MFDSFNQAQITKAQPTTNCMAFERLRKKFNTHNKEPLHIAASFPLKAPYWATVFTDLSLVIENQNAPQDFIPIAYQIAHPHRQKTLQIDLKTKTLSIKTFLGKSRPWYDSTVRTKLTALQNKLNTLIDQDRHIKLETRPTHWTLDTLQPWQEPQGPSHLTETIINEARHLAEIIGIKDGSPLVEPPAYYLGKLYPFDDYIVICDGQTLRQFMACLNDARFINPFLALHGTRGNTFPLRIDMERKTSIPAHRLIELMDLARSYNHIE